LEQVAHTALRSPDLKKFPALSIAYDVARRGGTLGAVMNAANEIAVASFESGKIRFPQISDIVRRTIELHRFIARPAMEDLIEADRWARRAAEELVANSANSHVKSLRKA
jgi:1-deoxy-D-xylulose-5-phosphate reductoisomerase